MNNALKELYDYKFFRYFDEISAIPRASKNRKPIADYCENFAKEHNLEYYRDEFDNVVIKKEATKGYENSDTVIIQGHLDMVAEKERDSKHNFDTNGLELIIDGDFIKANKTTLGGDDGIAIAYALAILDDNTLKHPPLKAVFTADEEIGLLGAIDLDEGFLEGRYMINIDSEEEGYFLNSCAGGQVITASIPYNFLPNNYNSSYFITVGGLYGGHSGAEIDKNRGNAGKILGDLLVFLDKTTSIGISYIDGGKKDNAIMREACAKVSSDDESIIELIKEFEKNVKLQFANIDKEVYIKVEKIEKENNVLSSESFKQLKALLACTPNGVLQFEETQTHYVQTSLNLGIITMNPSEIIVSFLVRSSIDFAKHNVIRQIEFLCDCMGIEYSSSGEYPGWAVNNDSKLTGIMSNVYEDMFGTKPVVMGIHAGLECGIFYKKNPELDIVSMGPDMYDIHTPAERLSISSSKRTWDFLIKVLEGLM